MAFREPSPSRRCGGGGGVHRSKQHLIGGTIPMLCKQSRVKSWPLTQSNDIYKR